MTPLHTMYVRVGYDLLASVERYIRDTGLLTEDVVYTDAVMFPLLIPTNEMDLHQCALTDLTAGRAQYQLGEQKYTAVPIE